MVGVHCTALDCFRQLLVELFPVHVEEFHHCQHKFLVSITINSWQSFEAYVFKTLKYGNNKIFDKKNRDSEAQVKGKDAYR
jgi:hypothetical protein